MRLPKGLLNGVLRWVEKPALALTKNPLSMRRRFEIQARLLFPPPPFHVFLPDVLEFEGAAIPAQWANGPGIRADRVILYMHGGGYLFGSSNTHRALAARLSGMTGMAAILPDYRLAPEHPFPAAVEDAVLACRALLARGYAPEKITLAGDSAGGGLTMALLHEIAQHDLPRPAAVLLFSPWTDLTLSGESLKTNKRREAYLPAGRMRDGVAYYLGPHPADDPRASPLFGAYPDAPPVMIQVGSTEILLDDSRRLAAHLQAQGAPVRLDIWEDLPHVWHIFQPRLKEANAALAEAASFVKAHVA